jgi:hypothetical protein
MLSRRVVLEVTGRMSGIELHSANHYQTRSSGTSSEF